MLLNKCGLFSFLERRFGLSAIADYEQNNPRLRRNARNQIASLENKDARTEIIL